MASSSEYGHLVSDDDASTDAPPPPPPSPMWQAGAHILLVVLAYAVLLVWVSFGPGECPKK